MYSMIYLSISGLFLDTIRLTYNKKENHTIYSCPNFDFGKHHLLLIDIHLLLLHYQHLIYYIK